MTPDQTLTRRAFLKGGIDVAKIAIAVPLIAGCEALTLGEKWDHYVSSVLPFEADYPPGAYIQHNRESEEFRDVADYLQAKWSILVRAEPVSPSIKLPEYQRKIEDIIIEEIRKKGGKRGLEGGTLTVNGQEAALAKGTMPRGDPTIYINDREYEFRTAIFIAKGSGWMIMFSFPPKEVEAGEAKFKRFASSFKVR